MFIVCVLDFSLCRIENLENVNSILLSGMKELEEKQGRAEVNFERHFVELQSIVTCSLLANMFTM